jgi:hypothetical protein
MSAAGINLNSQAWPSRQVSPLGSFHATRACLLWCLWTNTLQMPSCGVRLT